MDVDGTALFSVMFGWSRAVSVKKIVFLGCIFSGLLDKGMGFLGELFILCLSPFPSYQLSSKSGIV